MPLRLPDGKRFAVVLSPDFDAQSVWMGTFRSSSQTNLSRGEFGAKVGAPRLLEALRNAGITTTWCVPTHTMQTFPEAVEAIVSAGHEIAAHGVYHEFVPKLDESEERRLLELQLDLHEKVIGTVPRGYRSPALDITVNTISLLEELGFQWDSSLMGRDFEPYHPQIVTELNLESANVFAAPSTILEFPVYWALDDFPELESFKGSGLMQSNEAVLDRWLRSFDFGYERCPGGAMTITIHPQTIGRAHNLLMLESFIEYVSSRSEVWFPTLSQLADVWEYH
ncbi:polysaccharide deacetylase [Brevibacterium sp.]|uniref:polysaccharide deacetylase family protein n=1 Tax=Brevibacterium sp. TaxID=1701 RepID=UPI002811AFF5|nr:polysaccharide deacetylase [Brevibacterium sp.]